MKKLKQKKKVSDPDPDPIPYDLLIDIFSRVPWKSVGRFRCVSKLWRSTLGLPYFTELFLVNSLARPQLLFAIKVGKEIFFFSLLQPRNPVDNSSLVATRYKSFPTNFPSPICPLLCGLVFLRGWGRNKRVICNPVTGESITITLPKERAIGRSYLGYDPINKQFKILCMTWSCIGIRPNTHRVLTMETGNLKWRRTMECEHHEAGYGEICINGVLYYGARFGESCMIVCFDFTSEKFSFIKMHEKMLRGTLINHKGNLRVLVKLEYEVVLWVLEEDAEKHKWCKSMCVQIQSGISLSERIGIDFHIVGMTGAGEIVFSKPILSNPFYIVFYNIERNTFTRVYIQGFEQFQHGENILVNTFLDYAENTELLQDRFIT